MTGTDRRERPTVLVVDDEADALDAYAFWLADSYRVLTAESGDEALERIDDVDVVLLDRRMPDRSDDEVLEAIREQGFDCRVVMVTAVDPDFDIVDLGFGTYLTKPIDEDDLDATGERLLTSPNATANPGNCSRWHGNERSSKSRSQSAISPPARSTLRSPNASTPSGRTSTGRSTGWIRNCSPSRSAPSESRARPPFSVHGFVPTCPLVRAFASSTVLPSRQPGGASIR